MAKIAHFIDRKTEAPRSCCTSGYTVQCLLVGSPLSGPGPHQREVEKRFASFGTGATAVPISKSGKNALDFHLSFYMGYIASRNPYTKMVVVASRP